MGRVMDGHAAETFDQKYEREAAEADAYLARCAERRLERERSQALPAIEKPEPKAKQQMDREWNEWFAAGFRNFAALERKWVVQQLDELFADVDVEVDKKECKLRIEIRARVKTLEDKIAGLRAEIEILHRHRANKSDVAGVVPLRGRDVA
jgi:hypothetical protein